MESGRSLRSRRVVLSLADVAGFTIVRAYRKALDWRPERALVLWFERVAARPASSAALTPFGRTEGLVMIQPVDSLEITVLVDNLTDSLSSNPGFVEAEMTGAWRRGMKWLTGPCLCCAAHAFPA